MNLRTAVATVLDNAYDLKGMRVEVKLDDGTIVNATLVYGAGQHISKFFADRLIRANAVALVTKAEMKAKKTRVALTEEFGLKAD